MSGFDDLSPAASLSAVWRKADLIQVATGKRREVFAVPGHPNLLVKLAKPSAKLPPHKPFKRLIRSLLPATEALALRREVEMDTRMSIRAAGKPVSLPTNKIVGLMRVDDTIGTLVEAVVAPDGTLAPTLASMIERGLTPAELSLLNGFVAGLYDLHLVAPDLHARNIVYGTRGGQGAGQGGEKEFVLIDGYGERNVIPLRSLSRYFNDRSLDKRLAALSLKTGLAWDQGTRRFG